MAAVREACIYGLADAMRTLYKESGDRRYPLRPSMMTME